MLGWELPPHNSGGLGVACYHLCQHLADQGADIDFVVPYTADHSEISFMKVLGTSNVHPDELFSTQGIYRSAIHEKGNPTVNAYTEFVLKLISENDYDAIHAHDWLTYAAAVEAKRGSGLPLIAHVHATEFDRAGARSGNPLVHEIEYQGLLMADSIVAVSQNTKNIIIEKYQIPENKIQVIHNSIEPHLFDNTDSFNHLSYIAHKKSQGYKVFISIGRLTVQKGLWFLLEAFAKAAKKNPKALLVIAGSGEQYEELIEQAATLGVSKQVIFTGFVRGSQWRDVYNIGDAFIMPSVSEPFGLTALEAAGYGNLVLISKQSGVGEVLNNVLKFDYWDVDLLSTQICAISTYNGLSTSMEQELKREFKAFSWANAATKMKELYNRYTQGVAV